MTMKQYILTSVLATALLAIPAVVTAAPTSADPARALQDAFSRVYDDVGPAVVSIYTVQEQTMRTVYHRDPGIDRFMRQFFGLPNEGATLRSTGLGSGMIINKKGDILTNTHVVDGAKEIMVTLTDGRSYKCQLIGADRRNDVAVIRIVDMKKDDPALPTVRLGDSDKVRPGQWTIAIGNPFGIAERNNPQPTLTVGVVSAVRSLQTEGGNRDLNDMIQTDASINPGNSGGPLCDIDGAVIGINMFIVSAGIGQSAGIGFATPINRVKTILDDLRAGREVTYGYLGVMLQELDADMRQYFGLQRTGGALVSSVLPNAPAAKAGIRVGDIITQYNSVPVRNGQHLTQLVAGTPVGTAVSIVLQRRGK